MEEEKEEEEYKEEQRGECGDDEVEAEKEKV